MNNKPAPGNDDEILGAFADLFDQIEIEDADEVDALLHEAGLDPKQLGTEIDAYVKQLRADTPLDWRNQRKMMETVRSRYEQSGSGLPSDRQSLLEIWRQLMTRPRARTIAAHFRNQIPEDMSDEELRSLIQDIKFSLDDSAE